MLRRMVFRVAIAALTLCLVPRLAAAELVLRELASVDLAPGDCTRRTMLEILNRGDETLGREGANLDPGPGAACRFGRPNRFLQLEDGGGHAGAASWCWATGDGPVANSEEGKGENP